MAQGLARQAISKFIRADPRGYKKDHPLIDDLRRKDFIAIAPLDDRRVVTNALKTDVAKSFKTAVPFMQFLCKALEIPF